jgi:hypothetical protein
MSVSRLGSFAAVLGGAAWIVAALLAWGEDELGAALYLGGFALLVAAFAALGYALVSTAPVWLRAVVTLATPALGAMVWLIIKDAIPQAYVAAVVGGVLLVVGGGIGLSQAGGPAASEEPPPPQRGRRAAR